MKRIFWCLFLLIFLIWPRFAQPQIPGNATIIPFPGTPSGNCSARQLAIDQSNGSLYTCINAGTGRQGTWQIIAGGGGGGGWNPPSNIPGDTIFGNNTVGTGSPSFFIPGGDVSFSAGTFSVNNLHFGPNALSLTNTGIATGNCLQISGSQIIGGVCGTGAGGGGVTTGTVNSMAKYNTTTTVGPGLASDDGTTLIYTGTGGIAAPKITMNGAGPFELTSVTGSLPALPGTGKSALVSGPDGWYVSNNNAAYVGPLGVGGGGGGAVSSVFGRTGPVAAAVGDYDVSQVSGAAPLNDPLFTGAPQAPNPPANDDSQRLATTSWVRANGVGGGGPAVPIPITESVAPICQVESNTTTADITLSINLALPAGDTVLVGVSGTNVQVTDNAGTQYNLLVAGIGGVSGVPARIFATSVGGSHAATSVSLTRTGTSKFAACVVAYHGVASFGNTFNTTNATTSSVSTSVALQNPNSFIVSLLAANQVTTASVTSPSPARLLAQASTTATNAATAALCENTSATASTVSCDFSTTGTPYKHAAAIALECCAMTSGQVSQWPRVEGYIALSPHTDGTQVTHTVCTTINCPAGLYRVSFAFVQSGTSCTTGGALMPNLYYATESNPNKTYGMLNSPGFVPSVDANTSGIHVIHSAGSAPIAVSISPTACTSGGPGQSNLYVTVERLQ